MAATELFYDHLFKIIVIGEPGVGKTGLLTRFADDTFAEERAATADFKNKIIEVDGKVVKLQIWDTAGPERFKAITKKCRRGTQGALLVYDVTRKASFNALKPWLRELDKHVGVNVKRVLVANKCDRAEEEGVAGFDAAARAFADKLQMPLMRASGKTNVNVEEAFVSLATEIMGDVESKVLEGYESMAAALDRMRQRAEGVGDAVPVGRAIVGDAPPQGGAIVGDATPVGGAIVSNGVPVGGAIDGNAAPEGGAIVGDAAPEGGAIIGDATPDGGAIVGNAPPVGGAIVGNAAPEGGAIVGDAAPDGRAIVGNAAPEGGAIVGNAAPEGDAIVGNAAPEGGAIVGNSAPEGGAVVNVAEAAPVCANNRRKKKILKTRVFKSFQGRGPPS